MKSLDKRDVLSGKGLKAKSGKRKRLSSNNANTRFPDLAFYNDGPVIAKKMRLDYLADILISEFFEKKKNEEQ